MIVLVPDENKKDSNTTLVVLHLAQNVSKITQNHSPSRALISLQKKLCMPKT